MTASDAPGVALIDAGIIDRLMLSDSEAFTLLMYLLRHHRFGNEFAVADRLCTVLNWRRQRFIAARARLIEGGYLDLVREPMICRLSHRWMSMEEVSHEQK